MSKTFYGQILNFPGEISEFFKNPISKVKCEIQFYVDRENFMQNIEKPPAPLN